MERLDGRTPAQLRPVTIEMGFQKNAAGSCLVSFGNTRVICAASVENNVPPFLTGKGKGWLTAEYAMLPASTQSRKRRDGVKQDGRSVEIQRLIARPVLSDLEKLGEYHPAGLRCFGCRWGNAPSLHYRRRCALAMAVEGLKKQGLLQESPILSQVAAVSCGVVEDTPIVDLCYVEDSHAQVDMNFVMTGQGQFVEIQGTGEGRAFTREEMQQMLCMGQAAIETLFLQQKQALEALYE
ncbi:MAG: ribonuclease PH [Christensenellales bacterium]